MKKEFNLSEKRHALISRGAYYREIDVKEFIKRLKEEIIDKWFVDLEADAELIKGRIDKLVGEKLK